MPILGEIPGTPLAPKAAVFETMGYECYSDEVRDFHNSEAAIRIVTAPARGAKSYSAAPEIVCTALPHEPLLSSLQWIVGTDYNTIKEFDYVYEYLVDQRDRWTVGGQRMNIEKAHNNATNGNLLIVINWGMGPHGIARAIIEGKSATNEKSLQGEHITQWTQSEAAEHPSHIWGKYGATRSTRAIFPTTPKPKAEWLQKLCEDGEKDPSLSIFSTTFPYWSNPLYDVENFKRQKRIAEKKTPSGNAADDPYFAEQFLGHWVYYTGRVLPFHAENKVTLDEAWLDVPGIRLFVSTDYGYSDACVALFFAVLPSGALLIWDEIYDRELTTYQFVTAIEEKLKGREHQVAYVCGDPKQPQVARYMNDMGLNVIDINKRAQSDRAVGKRRLIDLLEMDERRGHPMLFVAEDRCPKVCAEWKHLRYKKDCRDENATNAFEGDDHAFDAARYGVMTMPEPEQAPEERDWLSDLERQQRRAGQFSGESATQHLARTMRTGRSRYGRAA